MTTTTAAYDDPLLRVHATIGRLTDPQQPHQLPGPRTVDIDRGLRIITLRMHNRAEVDAWARHLGMAPAREAVGVYAAIEFRSGWCGCDVLSITTPGGTT